MLKFKVGDLVNFLIGIDYGMRERMGIIIDYNAVAHFGIWKYYCYDQILMKYFWVEEHKIKLVEEEWQMNR